MVKVSPRIIIKWFFTLDKYRLKIWVDNSVSAIQHIGNREGILEVFPPPLDQADPFVCSSSLHYTHHIKCRAWSKVGRLSICSLTKYYNCLLVTNFVLTCGLISIYNGMYTIRK